MLAQKIRDMSSFNKKIVKSPIHIAYSPTPKQHFFLSGYQPVFKKITRRKLARERRFMEIIEAELLNYWRLKLKTKPEAAKQLTK